MRFQGVIFIRGFEIEYRRRFAGNEADIRFMPQQPFKLLIEIDIPMMVHVLNGEKEIQDCLNKNCREINYHLEEVCNELLIKDQQARESKLQSQPSSPTNQGG